MGDLIKRLRAVDTAGREMLEAADELERLTAALDAVKKNRADEFQYMATKIDRLTASRDEWERLWKKASMSVIDLQDKVAKLEAVIKDRIIYLGHCARLDPDRIEQILKEALDKGCE